MDIRHLQYFVTVAREGHFSRAAAGLQIAQPALSKQIRDLEAELGGALFDRTTRRVELTALGRLLQPEAERILEQFQHARRTARQFVSGEIGPVRLGFSGNAFVTQRVVDRLRQFQAARPGVSVQISEMVASAQVEAILEGRLDIGLHTVLDGHADEALRTKRIESWPWVVALAENHERVAAPDLKLTDLSGERFIMYASDETDKMAAAVLQSLAGEGPHNIVHSNSTMNILGMVAIGMGVALLPSVLSMLNHPGVRYVPISDRLPSSQLIAVVGRSERAGPAQALFAMFD